MSTRLIDDTSPPKSTCIPDAQGQTGLFETEHVLDKCMKARFGIFWAPHIYEYINIYIGLWIKVVGPRMNIGEDRMI